MGRIALVTGGSRGVGAAIVFLAADDTGFMAGLTVSANGARFFS